MLQYNIQQLVLDILTPKKGISGEEVEKVVKISEQNIQKTFEIEVEMQSGNGVKEAFFELG